MIPYIALILSVIIGYTVAVFLNTKDSNRFSLLLAFSGAFLLSVTVFEYLPELYESSDGSLGVFIMAGILIQLILDFFSKGAEHGHIHINKLDKRFPLALFLSLSIHSLLEGVPVTDNDHMLYSVVIHKIPIAAILGVFLMGSGFKSWIVMVFLGGFAIMSPIGAYLSQNLEMLQEYLPYLNAIVVGIFLHVSTTILFESNKNHSFNLSKFIVVLIGILLAYFL